MALDLSQWTGVTAADTRTGLVTVRSGTTLRALNAELGGLGLAMANLGDIDAQTLAGALSTGTHGTGARLGGLATQVESLELVLADGSVVSCSATSRPELFAAARIGLGALGVITTVTLRCVPSFTLLADERPVPVEEVLEQFDALADGQRPLRVLLVSLRPQGPGQAEQPAVARRFRCRGGGAPDAGVAEVLGVRGDGERRLRDAVPDRPGQAAPHPRAEQVSSAALSSRSYTDLSHRVFVTPRRVRFAESEYAVPRESLGHVIAELRRAVPRLPDPVMFPVEVRVAAADDIWLSTAYGRESAYVAIHQYAGLPYRAYFDRFESIVAEVAGRPHWGKLHSLDAGRLRPLYPRFDEFRRVRAEVDPEARFGNSYLTRVLGDVHDL